MAKRKLLRLREERDRPTKSHGSYFIYTPGVGLSFFLKIHAVFFSINPTAESIAPARSGSIPGGIKLKEAPQYEQVRYEAAERETGEPRA